MYTVGYDSGEPGGDETIAIYSTPHEPRLSHQYDELVRSHQYDELVRILNNGRVLRDSPIYPTLEDLGSPDFDLSVELCRACYHTYRDCQCEVGGNI